MLKKELKKTIVWCAKHKHLINLLLDPDFDLSDVGFAAIAQPRTPQNRVRDKSGHIIRPVDEKKWKFVEKGKDGKQYYECLECQKCSN